VLDNVNNQFDTSKFDHIVEGGVEIKSGILQILDCPNSNVELEVKIKTGRYRIRVLKYAMNLPYKYVANSGKTTQMPAFPDFSK